MGLELPQNYRPSDDEPFMNERQREYFRRRLVQWKDDIIRESKETLQNLAQDSSVFGKILVLALIVLFLQWRPAGLFVARSRSLED